MYPLHKCAYKQTHLHMQLLQNSGYNASKFRLIQVIYNANGFLYANKVRRVHKDSISYATNTCEDVSVHDGVHNTSEFKEWQHFQVGGAALNLGLVGRQVLQLDG